jgi:hypothetical protein
LRPHYSWPVPVPEWIIGGGTHIRLTESLILAGVPVLWGGLGHGLIGRSVPARTGKYGMRVYGARYTWTPRVHAPVPVPVLLFCGAKVAILCANIIQ